MKFRMRRSNICLMCTPGERPERLGQMKIKGKKGKRETYQNIAGINKKYIFMIMKL